MLEEALTAEQNQSSAGMILDLRSNGGGWITLYETMASYFFSADNPMPVHVFDWYYYDAKANDLIKDYVVDYRLSAPRPELAFTGLLVILVDPLCASACEYFTQHLQRLDRATVVGQYSTIGAGGPIDQVKLPGGITFQYTMGRTTFAGGDEPNLEAKGVTPDVRVPVTLETELAKLRGEDPVLQAAIAELDRLTDPAAKLTSQSWQWSIVLDSAGQEVEIEEPANYTTAFADDGVVAIRADCNQAGGTYTLADETLTISLGPTTLAVCPAGSRSDEFLAYLEAAAGFQFSGEQLAILLNPDSGALGLGLDPVE